MSRQTSVVQRRSSSSPVPSSGRAKPVVLVADDDDDLRAIIVETLRARGYATIEASNGERAVQKALAFVPDVVVLDMSMPMMGGLAAARCLRAHARTKNTAILMLTAYAMGDAGADDFPAPYDAYLEKTYTPRALLDAVYNALLVRRGRDSDQSHS